MITKAQKKYITAVLEQLVDDAGYEHYEYGDWILVEKGIVK